MSLDIESVSLQLITALKPLVSLMRKYDRSLVDQLTRAANSIALNVGEARYSDPGTRRSRYFTAAGSANETRTALRVAVAWGHLSADRAEGALALLDRIVAMLWKLSR